MAKGTDKDFVYTSDDGKVTGDWDTVYAYEHGGQKDPQSAAAAQAGNVDPNHSLGVAFGGSNPGTPVPGHYGLVVGPDGKVHDQNLQQGTTQTQYNLHNQGDFGNLQGAIGTDNIGNPVVNDGTGDGTGKGNTVVGNANPPPQDTTNLSQPNAAGSPNTAPGTLVPGGANISDLTHRDPRDFEYGRTPGYGRDVVGQARTQAQNFGTESRALGQTGADIGNAYGGALNDIGVTGANLGNQYGTQAAAAGQRGTEVGAGVQRDLNSEAALARARGASMGSGLRGLEETEGPSAAQAMLQSGTNQAVDNALSIARSHRGFGGSAAGVAQAAAGMPAAQATAANQAATLRANENALWRARQAQNLGTAAQVEQRGLDQSIGATQAGGNAAMQGTQQGMQGATAGGQLALSGNEAQRNATQAGGQFAMGGNAAQQSAAQNAQNQFWQGESLADKVTGSQSQQDQAYENMLTQEKGINAGIAINAANNQQSIWPAVIGAGATGLAMAASDERNKDIDHEVKLSSAIRGNPYGSTGAPGINMRKGPLSDLSPYGSGPMGGQQNYAAAQEADQKASARSEMENEKRLQAAIHAAGSIGQAIAAPRRGDPSAGQAMVNQALSYQMQPVRSDERSKNKIDDLESQLAAARQGLSGPPATAGVPKRDVNTAALDAATPDFRQSPNYAYTYKDPTIPGAAPGPQVGPMAQDLEKAGSQSVVNTPTGKMVDPSRLVMETAGAVGEQQSRQDDLERQFAELEAMLKAPKNRGAQGASAR